MGGSGDFSLGARQGLMEMFRGRREEGRRV